MQHWQTFFILAHIWQSTAFLYRPEVPAFHLNTVKGRSQMLQAWPNACFVMRTYGLSPRHVSQMIGNSEFSHTSLLSSFLICCPRSMVENAQRRLRRRFSPLLTF